MFHMHKVAEEFLYKYNMHHAQIDFKHEVDLFLTELNAGLKGQQSSLKINPSYIGLKAKRINNKSIVAIDIGGTNLRIAQMRYDNAGKLKIKNLESHKMPGSINSVTCDEFIKEVCAYTQPFIKNVDLIAISFAFNIENLPNGDAKIEKLSKEVSISGIESVLLGETIKKELECRINRPINIVVTNDTIATALAGISVKNNNKYDTFIGLIIGTGTNSSYVEDASKIIMKNADYKNKNMIINTESGDYSKQKRGIIDLQFDLKTNNPGDHTFEKMVSGKYLGPLIGEVLKKAAEEKLFSINSFDSIINKELYRTNEINHLFYNIQNYKDRLIVKCIIQNMIKRAAKLIAIVLTAEAIQSNFAAKIKYKVCITAEGSTFYKLKGLKRWIKFYLKTWLQNAYGIRFSIIKVQNAVLKGVAALGLYTF